MAGNTVEKGITLEVLGTCMTNTTPGSTHVASVEYRHLWSYAQQAALIAVSDKNPNTGCYELVKDPERRAKRIAAHYADLYFKSAEKSRQKVQFYWVALAAFVVKDIVEAYRFSREEVLHREWKDFASALRNSLVADIGSQVYTNDSPYQHVIRTYSALAKGNLWLFMDIYPWMWFFLEYGINADGTLNKKRLDACLPHRDWNTYHSASKEAIEQLPYGPAWIHRLKVRLNSDFVYQKAGEFFKVRPLWDHADGYGQHATATLSAHRYCRTNVKNHDLGYRTPLSNYWGKFQEAYYVMEAEHIEMGRASTDPRALAAVVKCRNFTVTPAVRDAYKQLINGYAADEDKKATFQRAELVSIANHEQINVLQSLIYDDHELKETMDMNHEFSRKSAGWISPQFKVIYSASPQNKGSAKESVFDVPEGTYDQFFGSRKSLPNQSDRMEFVTKIADDFNNVMEYKLEYMEGELGKIRKWLQS